MPEQEKLDIPAGMQKVHERLEGWRRTRQGSARIPRRLWVAVGSLAREYGVNPHIESIMVGVQEGEGVRGGGTNSRQDSGAAVSGTGGVAAGRGWRVRD